MRDQALTIHSLVPEAMIIQIRRIFKSLYSPVTVDPRIFYLFMTVNLALSMISSSHFNAVIEEHKSIQKDTVFQIQSDAHQFIIQLKDECIDVFTKFPWLNDFAKTMNRNRQPASTTVRTRRIYSYVHSIFNTFMMHFLLRGNLPVTMVALLPGCLSLAGTCIPPKSVLLFGCVEFSQVFIGFMVISVAFFDIVSHVRAD